ncbi:MAG: ABC transporter permease, partial [Candidatus Electrothrix sp. AUS4]|nr:ABC transporter permease [Candidatus Electrothrix sp. AUS4]
RVFVKDVSEIIGVLLQIGFWATPIFWDVSTISPDHRWIFKLNPACYIIQGYRNTFINHIWFWETATVSIYFISISSIFFVLGAIVFKRLRPHFGDVL